FVRGTPVGHAPAFRASRDVPPRIEYPRASLHRRSGETVYAADLESRVRSRQHAYSQRTLMARAVLSVALSSLQRVLYGLESVDDAIGLSAAHGPGEIRGCPVELDVRVNQIGSGLVIARLPHELF